MLLCEVQALMRGDEEGAACDVYFFVCMPPHMSEQRHIIHAKQQQLRTSQDHLSLGRPKRGVRMVGTESVAGTSHVLIVNNSRVAPFYAQQQDQ